MAAIPLIAHGSSASVVAYRGGTPIRAGEFLADVARLALLLPAGGHVLNACADRYRFAVGLGAGIVSNSINLLPPTQVPEVIRQLRAFAPDTVCLTDEAAREIDLPIIHYPTTPAPALKEWRVPLIPGDQRVAYVFTSGSTGAPIPHGKTWGRLAASVRIEVQRLGIDDTRSYTLVATVPPQHMYGFESSVLVALHSGQAFCAERPFYPADIVRVLASVPPPRIFVSTPIHLRALLAADMQLPELVLVLCATAPLDASLAASVEARFAAPLLEIYGSTETGQLASRQTTAGEEWKLWPGVSLDERDGRTWAAGGHVETRTPLGDIVEQTAPGQFLMRGRTEDLVNIAGKRSSLAYLNHQLFAIPGVQDGAFFFGEEPGHGSVTGTARLAAVVVAPDRTVEEIIRELRQRIDAVFLPRPLLIVDSIPRNSTGKIPQRVMKSFMAQTGGTKPGSFRQMMTVTDILIPASHPAFAGHFPGMPIVPGVVLLDEVLSAIAAQRGVSCDRCSLIAVKFKAVVSPGQPLTLRLEVSGSHGVCFELLSAGRPVASGAIAVAVQSGTASDR